MKKVNKIIILTFTLFALVAMVFSISGCARRIASNIVEEAIESAAAGEGEDVDIDIEEGEINITDDEGTEINIGGADIPDDWPSSIPVNNNIAVQYSGKQATEGKSSWYISGVYNGESQELYDYYKSEFSGWNQESDAQTSAEDLKTFYYGVSNDSYYVSLIISDTEDEGVTVTFTVNEK
jgi:hypothetical protein